MRGLLIVVIVAAAADASAETPVASTNPPPRPPLVETEPAPVPQPPEPSAKDAQGAPVPGAESGRIDRGEDEDSTGREVARGALFVPKSVFEIAMWPVEQGVYLENRYELTDLYYRMFYFEDRTIGIEPAATWETGFGLTVGARAFDLDTFGDGERVVLQATVGTAYRLGVLGSIDTGHRLGPVRLEAGGNFDRRPQEPFYGIGNEGNEQPAPVNGMIDPLVNPTAVKTFFRYQEARAVALADLTLVPELHAFARGAYAELTYSPSTTNPSINEVYDTNDLVGFDTKTRHLYGELELRWDDRRRVTPWEPLTLHAEGSLAALYGGYSDQLEMSTGFWHYGAELQHCFRLAFGPRVLVARLHGEAVTGNLAQIPITELPMLGGGAFLRGYPYARFRDRIALLGSVQYMWPLFHYASAYLFTDVGRVYQDWNQVDLSGLHAGFGIGLELFTPSSFLMDLSIATSTDGGITFMAEFSPVLDARPRWR
jgi:hypothetical protein